MYRVRFSDSANRFYHDANAEVARRINKAVEVLKVSPWTHKNIKRLSGPLTGYLRFRVGEYRVVYGIEETRKEVIVLLIAKREDVYRRMKRKS